MIKTVGILGAGAVGCYFLAGLYDKLGENLCVIADGERKKRLLKNGLDINNCIYHPIIQTPDEANNIDLLIVAVKYGALPDTLNAIKRVVGPHTIVMSVMNGVDSEEIIGAEIGMEHIVYSMIKIASERHNNHIVFDAAVTAGVFFGEANGQMTERIFALNALFKDSGVHYHLRDNIIYEIWAKYALNIGMNLPQAIIGCGFGAYRDSHFVNDIRLKLRNEVVQIAAAKDVDISDITIEKGVFEKTVDKARFSTLQDLDAKRYTEIEMFSGTLIRMGKELAIPTPYNEIVYDIIKALEEKNAGQFNY